MPHTGLRAPQPARWQLRHREQGTQHLPQYLRSRRGPAVSNCPRELARRARFVVGHHRPARCRELVEIHSVEFLAVGPENPLAQHGIVAGPPRQCVLGGEQVHGASHEMGSDHATSDQHVRELRRVERAQPRPETDERFLRLLRLHAAQVLDRVDGRHVGAVEQQLPGECRAVECPGVQDRHVITFAWIAARRCPLLRRSLGAQGPEMIMNRSVGGLR
ncbi:hypothetical protein EV192_103318 [Actinocrispum wychmicini]|uniref:Uncharacterized protein n=1 Tax=Actinocrispum wychmicini TaxID=1213861 RepID=A0A4R2JL19_9PSEU|nr:hypothetical protein EV192_103318 [Actinocrispum wychmicini]